MSSKKRKNVLDDESKAKVEPRSKKSKEIDAPKSDEKEVKTLLCIAFPTFTYSNLIIKGVSDPKY
jgi:hypothetical protein